MLDERARLLTAMGGLRFYIVFVRRGEVFLLARSLAIEMG